MRVLVTGGAGFTGKALVRRMLDADTTSSRLTTRRVPPDS
jgi:nucleoside-diphosphate-sugar epimerase